MKSIIFPGLVVPLLRKLHLRRVTRLRNPPNQSQPRQRSPNAAEPPKPNLSDQNRGWSRSTGPENGEPPTAGAEWDSLCSDVSADFEAFSSRGTVGFSESWEHRQHPHPWALSPVVEHRKPTGIRRGKIILGHAKDAIEERLPLIGWRRRVGVRRRVPIVESGSSAGLGCSEARRWVCSAKTLDR